MQPFKKWLTAFVDEWVCLSGVVEISTSRWNGKGFNVRFKPKNATNGWWATFYPPKDKSRSE